MCTPRDVVPHRYTRRMLGEDYRDCCRCSYVRVRLWIRATRRPPYPKRDLIPASASFALLELDLYTHHVVSSDHRVEAQSRLLFQLARGA
jgi:hypothetical protein